MVLTRRLASGVLLVTALTVLTTGCAHSQPATLAVMLDPKAVVDPLAAQTSGWILQHALTGTEAASAVHVTGKIQDSGHTITFNLSVAGSKGCSGTMKESGAGSFQLITDTKSVWIKPDDDFWKNAAGVPASQLKTVEGKYLQGSATSADFSALVKLCNMKSLLSGFGKSGKGEVKGPISFVGGQRAVKISDTADSAYIYATDAAQPKLLQLADPNSASNGLTFDYPATPVTIKPPPDDLILTQ